MTDLPITPVRLAQSLHTAPPRAHRPKIRAHLHDAPHSLAVLARHAQAGDPHALLMAAVLIRDRLHAIATDAAGGDSEKATLRPIICARCRGASASFEFGDFGLVTGLPGVQFALLETDSLGWETSFRERRRKGRAWG